MIALNLSDKDVASFRLICHSTNDAIDADYNRFWFLRWRQQYDSPKAPHRGHAHTKRVYQDRVRDMHKGFRKFTGGKSPREKVYLEAIKQIIIGKSISHSPYTSAPMF